MRRWLLMLVPLALVATSCYKRFDFTGDNKADLYFVNDDNGDWYRLNPAPDPPTHLADGHGLPAPGDYDGNGTWEPAANGGSTWWSAATGTTTFARPSNAGAGFLQAVDVVPADYNGDHKTDRAFYRESDATWFIEGQAPIQFGTVATSSSGSGGSSYTEDQDFPVPADYDGDGKADLATWNPRTHVWRIRSSKTGTETASAFGGPSAWPAPGDYDGDGKTDRAVLRWDGVFIVEGQGETTVHAAPVPPPTSGLYYYPTVADFDGDGKDDMGIADLPLGNATPHITSSWYIRMSGTGLVTNLTLPGSTSPNTVVPRPVSMREDLIIATARINLVNRCVLLGPPNC